MGLDIGDEAPDFKLKGTDGVFHSLEDYSYAQAIIIIFTCNHCPYAQAYEKRIAELQEKYDETAIIAINSNDPAQYPEDSYETMVERAEEQEYPYAYLVDSEEQHVARLYGATHTPEAFLLGPERTLQYRGRIDDNWRDPNNVDEQSLREALEAVLEENPVKHPLRPAIGCTIKWK